jgi:hypothetical protein
MVEFRVDCTFMSYTVRHHLLFHFETHRLNTLLDLTFKEGKG